MKVTPGGSAEQIDVELVRAKLNLIPRAILDDLDRRGIGVVVCRESVTDYRRDMAGVHPRNWPDGVTWDVVPGCYLPDENNVAIATIADGADRRVPAKGEKHGSYDLVIHEVMHADDYVGDRRRSDNAAFTVARQADVDSGRFDDNPYEAAVMEEAYAESAARVFGSDPQVAETWPQLQRFWESAMLPIAPGTTRRDFDEHDEGSIGTVTVGADGGFILDLVATDDKGRIGHAYVVLKPGDAGYEPISERLQSDRRDLDAPNVPVLLAPF